MLVPISMFPFIRRLWEGHQNWLSCEQPQKLMKGDDFQGEGLHRRHPTLHSGHKQFPPGRQAGWHSPGHTWWICTGNARVCVSGCLLQSCSAKLLTVPSSCLLHHCSWDLFALENGPFSGTRKRAILRGQGCLPCLQWKPRKWRKAGGVFITPVNSGTR